MFKKLQYKCPNSRKNSEDLKKTLTLIKIGSNINVNKEWENIYQNLNIET